MTKITCLRIKELILKAHPFDKTRVRMLLYHLNSKVWRTFDAKRRTYFDKQDARRNRKGYNFRYTSKMPF